MLDGTEPTTWLRRRGHEIGLLMHPHGRVVGAPLIASHVGADIAADLVAVDFAAGSGIRMLVDIGTNTEVVVTDGTRVLAASCPAGPAFEGGLIRFGMPGADGAIETVTLLGDEFAFETIGATAPTGICGSGLVDILAELRRREWMNTEGRFHLWPRRADRRARAGHHVFAFGCEPARPGQGGECLRPAHPPAPPGRDRRPGR